VSPGAQAANHCTNFLIATNCTAPPDECMIVPVPQPH
jgi:hypothetical protein